MRPGVNSALRHPPSLRETIPVRRSGPAGVPLLAALVAALWLSALAPVAMPPACAQQARLTAPETDLKAAYLLSFIRYVRRAEAPVADDAGEITVAVVGDAGLGRALEAAVRGKHIDGRGIRVASLREPDSLRAYDMVFIGLALTSKVERALEQTRGAPVLTVGECDDFVDRGGMIGLFFDERKLRFAINRDAADRAGLRISSSLLSLAAEVRGRAR